MLILLCLWVFFILFSTLKYYISMSSAMLILFHLKTSDQRMLGYRVFAVTSEGRSFSFVTRKKIMVYLIQSLDLILTMQLDILRKPSSLCPFIMHLCNFMYLVLCYGVSPSHLAIPGNNFVLSFILSATPGVLPPLRKWKGMVGYICVPAKSL